MHIEQRLESIDDTLKAILQALLSGGTAVALLGTPDAAASAEKKTRTKKDKEAESTEWDSNPRRRITGAVSSPLDDRCMPCAAKRRRRRAGE